MLDRGRAASGSGRAGGSGLGGNACGGCRTVGGTGSRGWGEAARAERVHRHRSRAVGEVRPNGIARGRARRGARVVHRRDHGGDSCTGWTGTAPAVWTGAGPADSVSGHAVGDSAAIRARPAADICRRHRDLSIISPEQGGSIRRGNRNWSGNRLWGGICQSGCGAGFRDGRGVSRGHGSGVDASGDSNLGGVRPARSVRLVGSAESDRIPGSAVARDFAIAAIGRLAQLVRAHGSHP